jgi:hypothetical protein
VALCRDGSYQPGPDPPRLAATHVIYTRFSVAMPRVKITTFDGRSTLADAKDPVPWLKNRIHLFNRFCLPSVLNQTKRPDLWMIAFSEIGKEALEPFLETLKRYPWIVPIWQRRRGDEYERDSGTFYREYRRRIDRRSTHVITARLDSDDAIDRSFLEDVDRYATAVVAKNHGSDDFWVSFPIGMQLAGGECRLYNSLTNHFLCHVQTIEAFKARKPYTGGHVSVFERGPVHVAVTEGPMWLEIIHGSNAANRARRELPLLASPAKLLARCGVEVTLSDRMRWWRPSQIPAHLWSLRKTIKRNLRAAGLMKPKQT